MAKDPERQYRDGGGQGGIKENVKKIDDSRPPKPTKPEKPQKPKDKG